MTESTLTYTTTARILSLDASTTNVGWCVATLDTPGEYLESGVYTPHGKHAMGRLPHIACWTRRALEKWHPAVVALEESTGAHGNARTDRLLGAVMGIVLSACVHSDDEPRLLLVNAMAVKATGLDKDHTWEVACLVGKDSVGGDEADAVGVWMAAQHILREEEWRAIALRA